MTGRMARSPNAESSHHSIEPNHTSELLPRAEKFHFKIAVNTRMDADGGEQPRCACILGEESPLVSARLLPSPRIGALRKCHDNSV